MSIKSTEVNNPTNDGTTTIEMSLPFMVASMVVVTIQSARSAAVGVTHWALALTDPERVAHPLISRRRFAGQTRLAPG